MQFPESWLREFCNPPLSTEQLAETLTMAGLEVEELKPVAPPFTHIVVGEIKETMQHPNADRLRVCQVDVGQVNLLTIVCGAANARPGIKVPCAMVGAELPPGEDGKPFVIKVGKLRGIESQGMLCSARELKVSEDHGGLLELAFDAPVGQDIREHLKLDDTLFTLKLTPNLAHCLSVFGVAREVAALTGAPLNVPSFPAVRVGNSDRLPVVVSAPDLCGRFSGRIVRNINSQATTPFWMVERLARCGQRSVTPLVDISNYVMFELGRPSHIFDLDKIHGGLDVRWGRPGETIKLLNSNTVSIDEKVGVIADDLQVESLAGIMGGDATAVSDETKNIYVEAAFWWPKAIVGRSRRYNFSTDAGHRFERGVDAGQTVEHIERITQLIVDICGTGSTSCSPVDDVRVNLPRAAPVTMRVARAAKVIGMPLTQAQCLDAFCRLGLEVSQGEGTLTVTPPSYRFDLQIEEDLIEEVVRMVGYDQLPQTAPLAPITAKLRPETERSPFAVRRVLASLGYQETINFSFVEESWEHELAGNPNPIKLLNPIANHMSVMRSSLLGSLVHALKFNLDRKALRANVFELGRVFLRDLQSQNTDTTVAGFNQPMRIAGLAYGPRNALHWGQSDKAVDFFDVKGDVEALLSPLKPVFTPALHPAMHPGRCANVSVSGQSIGFVGELHPQWRQKHELVQAPIVFELDLDAVLQRQVPVFESVSKLQPVERDVAVIVPEGVTHAALMAAIDAANTKGLLQKATLFDIYRPQHASTAIQFGEKSLAIRLVLSSDVATLTDEAIESTVEAIVVSLQNQVQARLRA
ncbi:MAG: phenylalanyl-tRNA synthetase beta subunit [Polaromonas sp.]|nr:phenylalanyl-tRNA synthetase beta subunit [Polaromonas sp.]